MHLKYFHQNFLNSLKKNFSLYKITYYHTCTSYLRTLSLPSYFPSLIYDIICFKLKRTYSIVLYLFKISSFNGTKDDNHLRGITLFFSYIKNYHHFAFMLMEVKKTFCKQNNAVCMYAISYYEKTCHHH